ncbi:hypothetical protein LJ656_18265 [Paraburkholderia sp. MMS20-SJTR3]|uniref:Uncharacterized protein n=1 Tax=Paraburkholderia sejongensis TaxID=2886946 RepID=A0ABS8JXC1_9BURK|nr:hypothetical protein [Paraburkholderia sp. MMS20-SJTR3]MCC8394540.1 hypothetical protein [Paraburkholderia sp. MMS20-SJTR3]
MFDPAFMHKEAFYGRVWANAQTKPDRTRGEQASEIGGLAKRKKMT